MANITFNAAHPESDYLSQIRRNFTERAASYNSGLSGASHTLFIQSLLKFHPPDYPILDIACGTGLLACVLANRGQDLTGLDLTPAMLHQARLLNPEGTFVTGRAEQLPFEDATFQTVYCCSALVYFTDVPRVMREARRVLRPGGWLAYQAVTLDSYVMGIALDHALRVVLGEERARSVFQLPHGITHTREANERLLREAGFEAVEARRVTVLSSLQWRDLEEGWDRLVEREDRNAMTMRVAELGEGERARVREEYVRFLEQRRGEDNAVTETVSSWYIRGRRPGSC
eukprot:GFKZ01000445.1.p1 GENE.GFKZ01000445.1~~GFKZ01000445.1.p1  ORF type:complete len:298 (-),score=38.91 GFKZ01000445.1:1038-1898(-)